MAGKQRCEREGGRKEGRGKEMDGRREREGDRWEDRRVEMGGDVLSLSLFPSPALPSLVGRKKVRGKENSNSKTLFYKDCSLGSIKTSSNN